MPSHRPTNLLKFLPYRQERIIGINNDREGAVWQDERGPRYGNNRKGIAKDKLRQRRQDRLDRKRQTEKDQYE